jgi:hypothetical protein
MSPTPNAARSGGVAPAKERERVPLANDGIRTADLVGHLLLLQPLYDDRWLLDGDERDVTVTRTISIEPDGTWKDHGDLPYFWTVVRSALNDQSTDEHPWVVGRVARATKGSGGRAAPYILLAPTPEETVIAGTVLEAWQATPAPDFPDDAPEDPF